MDNYNDVLDRLLQCRNEIAFTQEQMGSVLGVKQEQYSNVENGLLKLPDGHLRILKENGFNIDYIITGKYVEEEFGELGRIFEDMEEGQKELALKFPAELLLNKVKGYGQIEERKEKYVELLAAMLQNWEDFSMVRFVRKQIGISQMEMAARLGVGIKKYREIEKEIRYPDAEMLLDFYNMSGYRPSFFMNFVDRRLLALNEVWNMTRQQDQRMVMRLVRYAKQLL